MLTHWWVADAWEKSPIYLLAWVFWVIFSIVLHELAHGWTAIRCGDRTPIESGHMTWNPLVHMGQASLIMFAVVGIAWGLMPVNPANFRGRYDDAKVALAGPMMNFLLFAVAIVGCAAFLAFGGGLDQTTAGNLRLFFFVGAYLNLALMLFNLLPVPPLDGARILADLVPSYGTLWRSGNAPTLSLVVFLGVFWFGGPIIFDTAARLSWRALSAVLHAFGQNGFAPMP